MKTRLYRKFVRLVCKDFDISRKQLFSREYKDCVVPVYKYDIEARMLKRDAFKLAIFGKHHPLSTVWESYDVNIRWLLKYWKYSRHRAFVQTKLDLGYTIDDAIAEVVKICPRYVKS